MTTQIATLIAATIAALASLVKLFFDRSSEDRSSYRALLQPLVAELGEAIYRVLATSTVILKAKNPEARSNWIAKAVAEKAKLQVLRPKLRYPLWGLDEGIRVLTRIPDWLTHASSDEYRSKKLLSTANSLRRAIDIAAMRCYKNGRVPSALEIFQVRFYAWKCRRIFNARESNEEEE